MTSKTGGNLVLFKNEKWNSKVKFFPLKYYMQACKDLNCSA
jgi:hypothetical protein